MKALTTPARGIAWRELFVHPIVLSIGGRRQRRRNAVLVLNTHVRFLDQKLKTTRPRLLIRKKQVSPSYYKTWSKV
jgi:hypothetical protein